MQAPVEALTAVVVAGAFTGTALVPLKFAQGWKFENTWLLYSALAYLILPWLVAMLSVPHLSDVYGSVRVTTCALTALFGFGWGLAVVLNGIGVALIGLSLASAILMGSSIALGSLLPILFKDPYQIATAQGAVIVTLDLVMLAGVLLCACAGKLRAGGAATEPQRRSAAMRGILICFVAGVLSTLLNVALAFGEVIARQALAYGASNTNAANAIWSLAVSAGSLPSIVWCLTRLSRERQWSFFSIHFTRNAVLCALMACLFITGTVIYGAAAGKLGSFGPAVGWPVYMSGIILISNFWGWITGEWRGVKGAPVSCMLAGIAVQVVAILALGQIQ